MKLNKHLWLLLLLLTAFSISAAQNQLQQPGKKCPVRTLNYETGLINNATTFVLTDALGFTWISTKTGLQRFNGNRLETILPVINNDTLNINQPVYLFNLQNGNMWISYKDFVLEYNPYRNTFRKIITAEPSINNRFDIVPLKETTEGVWCMQEKKGVLIYSTDGENIQVISFYKKAIIDTLLSSDDILYKNIIVANMDCIFISTGRNEILKINTTTKKFWFLNYESSYRMCLACFHNTLFAVADGKLFLINADNNVIAKTVLIDKPNNRSLNNYTVGVDDKGHLFISVFNNLYEFDTAGNYKNEITDLNRNPVLNTGFIDKIYPDKFRRIWLLSNDNIIRVQNVETPFTHFIYPAAKNNFVRSLYYDEQKHVLLAGCINGGLQLYDTLANPLWTEPLATKDVKDVLSIEKLTANEYLIITFLNGWYVLSLPAKQIRPFTFSPEIKDSLASRLVKFTNNIQRTNDSTIFIATGANIFQCVFNRSTLKSAVPLLPIVNDVQNQVDCFLYATDKTLWTGTSTGVLYKLDKNDHAETRYK